MKLRRLVAACASLVLLGTLPVAQADATPAFRNYVALGDSYTSAPLVPVPDLLSLGCVRSYSNYPKMLAAALRIYRFTDVSCGGADTTNMTQPQSTPIGTAAPQFDALTPDTDLVTLGIGGNDFGVFGDIVGTCPGLRAGDPTGAPCKAHFTVDGVDTLKAKIAQTQTRIAIVVQGIKARSPQATVLTMKTFNERWSSSAVARITKANTTQRRSRQRSMTGAFITRRQPGAAARRELMRHRAGCEAMHR